MADSRFLNMLFLQPCLVLAAALPLEAAPVTDLYEITSGTYTEVGGFAGTWSRDLPGFDQAFIELTIDRELNTAEMQILDHDLRPFEFFVAGTPFTDGTVDGSLIVFHGAIFSTFFRTPGDLDYSVLLNGDSMSLQGELVSEPICCDIPSRFIHTGVEASLVPEPATRVLLALGLVILMLRSHSQVRGTHHA